MSRIPELHDDLSIVEKAAVVRATGCSDIQKGLRQWKQLGMRLEDNVDILECLYETVRFADQSGYIAAPREELYQHPE